MCYISVSRDLVESGGSREPEGDGKSSKEDRHGVWDEGYSEKEVTPRQWCPSGVLVLSPSAQRSGELHFVGTPNLVLSCNWIICPQPTGQCR